MNSLQQSCRPKHQVLILKCYPRFQKGFQEVKPNSSELSYLLYYASTRRSKLQKVGAFLEKRAARDVWRMKLGNVQVTLQILAALIEKVPRDLPLYALSVLTIIDTVLGSNDLPMVEETIETYDIFCRHQDMTVLGADQEYVNLYRNIVRSYAQLASVDHVTPARAALSLPLRMRWRNAGLRAIKSIVSSEALSLDGTKQLEILMPVILSNLYSTENLLPLQAKVLSSEKQEREHARRRRTSITTVRTVDTTDADPTTAAASTADADNLAEIEVRVLALRCLEKIFAAGSNRGQIRHAISLILQFIVSKRPPRHCSLQQHPDSVGAGDSWATNLMEVIAKWSPVQDRFIILITTLEQLVNTPMVDDKLESQLILASMMDWLLSSPNNLIGLSVIDVLISLLQRLLLLLQLGGRSAKMVHHGAPSGNVDSLPELGEASEKPIVEPNGNDVQLAEGTGTVIPWDARQELVELLQKCIGSLATHIYYTDQVSDMIRTIISRLKPSPTSELSNHEAEGDQTNVIDSSEDVTGNTFFSFPAARIVALKCIKNILMANLRKSMTAAGADSRSRVNIWVWEGTQWLLRDPDREVSHTYVDAFLSWLQLETTKDDLRATFETKREPKIGARREVSDASDKLTRKIISTVSQRDKDAAIATSNFLQLLHLTVYDIATEYAAVDSDIMLLHLLLANLVEKMGVNAAKYGLPMILRLQADFLSNDESISAAARINVLSLVHGYLWALVEKFALETTKVGDNILREISRRKQRGCWLENIQLPPRQLNHIIPSNGPSPNHNVQLQPDRSMYYPFTGLSQLVDQIENNYNTVVKSPTISPASSPGRAFSTPILGQGSAAPGRVPPEERLPTIVKERMLAPWSKEECLAAIATEKAQSSSISGSRTGTSATRNYFATNGHKNGNASPPKEDNISANPPQRNPDARLSGPPGITGGSNSLQKLRRQSVPAGSHTSVASSSRDSTVRVNELRRVLSVVNGSNVRHSSPLRGREDLSQGVESGASSAESILSDTFSTSDIGTTSAGAAAPSNRPQREGSETPKASVSNHTNALNSEEKNGLGQLMREISNDIPPVPPLPAALTIPGGFPNDSPHISPSYPPTGVDRPSTAPSQSRARPVTKDQHTVSTMPRQSRSLTRQKSRTSKQLNTPSVPNLSRYADNSVRIVSAGDHRASSSRGPGSISMGRRVDVEKLLEGLIAGPESGEVNGGGGNIVEGLPSQSHPPYSSHSNRSNEPPYSLNDTGYYPGKKNRDMSGVRSLGRVGSIARPPY
ncbi:conserved hypothetical protein [Histoplasma capsulatum G186AR]|uniref:Protein EFR3 n=2 Tax=Ajellomyces capsulatus TaxID=5037 RepID=C0NUU4_AJECG|nr:uncharacterized protein HCBG_06708 [Histoplasma capsulatum G186AR]EEH04757.1 conserved hypothetical protein [Histoplasma capsulatum G186AR]KAG5287412.1 protein EFR3 [Histoplasma capsulatum]QSS70776.1 protein EFR3 [Histoplasma capsulatum G186AR]